MGREDALLQDLRCSHFHSPKFRAERCGQILIQIFGSGELKFQIFGPRPKIHKWCYSVLIAAVSNFQPAVIWNGG